VYAHAGRRARRLPGAVRARYQLAVCQFARGDQKAARREFEGLPKESQADAGVTYYLGRLDLLANQYPSAVRRLSAIAAKPPFPDTAFYLGLAWYGQGDLQQAAHWLAEAAQLAPRDFRTHYRLARLYHDLGREAEAKKEYALSSELRESYQEGASQALDCSRSLKENPIAEAREAYRKLYDPNDSDKLTILGPLSGKLSLPGSYRATAGGIAVGLGVFRDLA
jgi:predicted Zn-dependent protease